MGSVCGMINSSAAEGIANPPCSKTMANTKTISGFDLYNQTLKENPKALTHYISDVDAKALELIQKHRAFEQLKGELEKMKLDYLTILMRQNIGAVNIKEGKINVCTRNTKDYGDTVKNMEASLKAEKTRLEYLGEFVIKATTHYLRIG